MISSTDLTFRASRLFGGLLEEPLGSEHAFKQRHRYIYLIHGFNVSPPAALKAYAPFKRYLENRHPILKRDTLSVSWPGSISIPGVGLFSYPLQVKSAIETAPVLGRYLARRRTPTGEGPSIIIICHSLGARLVAEAIEHMLNSPDYDRNTRVTVHMMAPAVPIGVILEAGELRSAFTKLNALYVHHSENDEALTWVFRSGQKAARSLGYDQRTPTNKQALGLEGASASQIITKSCDRKPFGHNEYWKKPDVPEFVSSSIVRTTRRKLRRNRLSRRNLSSSKLKRSK